MPVPLHGQIALTASAQPLSAVPVIAAAFTIKAAATNFSPAFVGASTVTTSNGHWLDPGDSFDYEHGDFHGETRLNLNLSDFYAVGTVGDTVTWLASP